MFCFFVDVQINSRPKRDLNFANWPELEGPRRNSTSVSIACCGGRRSGGGGGEGCFFSFSRLPSQYFPSSLFLFVLSPLFGYRHIHYGIKSLYDYVKTRNTSQTSLHWIHLRHECNFETVELCKFCLHYTTEHSQRLRHGRVGQLGPRYILIVTMSLQQSG